MAETQDCGSICGSWHPGEPCPQVTHGERDYWEVLAATNASDHRRTLWAIQDALARLDEHRESVETTVSLLPDEGRGATERQYYQGFAKALQEAVDAIRPIVEAAWSTTPPPAEESAESRSA